MRVVAVDTPEELAERAAPVLLADEARNNLALGILSTIVAHPALYPEVKLWLVENDGAVVAAALRTPPFNLVLPGPLDALALDALAAAIDDDLPGVTGAFPEVDTFAAAWCVRASRRPRQDIAEGIYSLEQVVPVTGVPGRMREATVDDRLLVSTWFAAFAAEALAGSERPKGTEADAQLERQVDARLGDDEWSGVCLWEDEGEVVSLAAFGGETPHGIRIGPVFTPPQQRSRGYASALTAALSTQLLDSGKRFCFLYTDLANATSNKIYRAIGYEHVCDAAEIVFE